MASYTGQLFGNYRLLDLLGEGGFAEVYLGKHIHLDTPAAIKVLTTKLGGDEIEQFRNEARMMIGMIHPHIMRVLDFGLNGRIPFIVMDYAPNGSLRKKHPKGSQLPLSTIVNYVKQIAAALQYVHSQKLIHRDVKPENMLLGQRNEILLSDFGIAAVAHSTRSLNTQEGSGTIYYMSPEQIQGKPRAASDQYALAVVAYEWLSGIRPFNGTYWEIASQHLSATPSSLCEKVPTIPLDVEKVVMKALSKDPHQRWPSVQEFAEALEQASQKPQQGTTLLSRPSQTQSSIAWSPDSTRIVITALEGTAQVWDIALQNILLTYGYGSSVAWSPDGTRIASISQSEKHSNVHLWNAATGQNLLTCGDIYDDVLVVCPKPLAWSPDGTLIASAGYDQVLIWNAMTGQELLSYHVSLATSVAWSPNGTSIASISDRGLLEVRDIRSKRGILIANDICSMAWSPDSTDIVVGTSDTAIQVLDTISGQITFTYHGHSGRINTVAWSPDGQYIASGSADHTVQIWNAIDGGGVFTYRGHTNGVQAVAWSPDGTCIASASDDGTMQVWQAM